MMDDKSNAADSDGTSFNHFVVDRTNGPQFQTSDWDDITITSDHGTDFGGSFILIDGSKFVFTSFANTGSSSSAGYLWVH